MNKLSRVVLGQNSTSSSPPRRVGSINRAVAQTNGSISFRKKTIVHVLHATDLTTMFSFESNCSPENLSRYRSRNQSPLSWTTTDRREGPIERKAQKAPRERIVSNKFRHPSSRAASHIFAMKEMSIEPQIMTVGYEVVLDGKTRRRLTSLTDVQVQSSFDDEQGEYDDHNRLSASQPPPA